MITSSKFTRALIAMVAATLMSNANALLRGETDGGLRFESGGISEGELADMAARKSEYTFWLTAAARGSGAHLADVDVRIVELPSRKLVLEHRTDGPWLLVALAPGRYEIEATVADVRPGAQPTQRRITTIAAKGLRQMTMYFDTGDEVGGSEENPPRR